jgi:hypothetical protein
MPDENDPKADEIQVKLNFRIPPRMPSVYAHHMYIQQGQNEVVISFFEVVPPVMTEQATEDRLKTLQEIGVVAECVARVTVAKESFPAFAKAMQQVANQISTPEVQETQDADNT